MFLFPSLSVLLRCFRELQSFTKNTQIHVVLMTKHVIWYKCEGQLRLELVCVFFFQFWFGEFLYLFHCSAQNDERTLGLSVHFNDDVFKGQPSSSTFSLTIKEQGSFRVGIRQCLSQVDVKKSRCGVYRRSRSSTQLQTREFRE